MSYSVTVRGKCGRQYTIDVYSKWTTFPDDLSAVYLFLAPLSNKEGCFKILYIGKSTGMFYF